MPNIKYTVEERSFLVTNYGSTSLRALRDKFAEKFINRPTPSASTIKAICDKFKNTGCVNNIHLKVVQPNKQLTEEQQQQIVLAVEENPFACLRTIAEIVGVSKSSVYKVLHREGLKPYKPSRHQKLLQNDYQRRMIFCEIMMERINNNQNFLRDICFSDECTIYLTGTPNRQNLRYWGREKPDFVLETNTQFIQKLNVWVGLMNNRIVGPFFFEGNLNGQQYREYLEDIITPVIQAYAAAQGVSNKFLLIKIMVD